MDIILHGNSLLQVYMKDANRIFSEDYLYLMNKHYPHCALCTRHASPSPVAKNRRPMGVERAAGGSLLLVPCQSIPRSSSAPDVHSKFIMAAPAVGGTR